MQNPSSTPPNAPHPRVQKLLRLTDVRPEEVSLLLWSMLYIFCVLSSYYVIRPVRDTLGIDGGVNNLQWLFAATLGVMLLLTLPFSALSARLPRRRFIPWVYRFFISHLIIFALLMTFLPQGNDHRWLGRVFFVWVSVFNLYVVSVFWSMVADIFDRERASRLFSLMAAGATLGAVIGSLLTTVLVRWLSMSGLFILSAVLLEVAVFCVRRLNARVRQHPLTPLNRDALPQQKASDDGAVGGGIFAGIAAIARSGYLLNICLYMLLFSVTSTFVYFRQAALVDQLFTSNESRTTFFAVSDLAVNILTLLSQLLITGRLLSHYGTRRVLAILPLITLAGFALLSVWPTLAGLFIFAVLRRAGNFAFARPAREVLFTVLSREEKYKAKNVTDTVVYRVGDQAGAWSWTAMNALGLSGNLIAWLAIPLSLIWLLNSLWLGKKQHWLDQHKPQAKVPASGESL